MALMLKCSFKKVGQPPRKLPILSIVNKVDGIHVITKDYGVTNKNKRYARIRYTTIDEMAISESTTLKISFHADFNYVNIECANAEEAAAIQSRFRAATSTTTTTTATSDPVEKLNDRVTALAIEQARANDRGRVNDIPVGCDETEILSYTMVGGNEERDVVSTLNFSAIDDKFHSTLRGTANSCAGCRNLNTLLREEVTKREEMEEEIDRLKCALATVLLKPAPITRKNTKADDLFDETITQLGWNGHFFEEKEHRHETIPEEDEEEDMK